MTLHDHLVKATQKLGLSRPRDFTLLIRAAEDRGDRKVAEMWERVRDEAVKA